MGKKGVNRGRFPQATQPTNHCDLGHFWVRISPSGARKRKSAPTHASNHCDLSAELVAEIAFRSPVKSL